MTLPKGLNLPKKLICGVLHYQVKYNICNEQVWTQIYNHTAVRNYICSPCIKENYRVNLND